MSFFQFMEKIYEMVLRHLDKAGLTIVVLVAAIALGIDRISTLENKMEVITNKYQVERIESDKRLLDCEKSKSAQEEKIAALEEKVTSLSIRRR